MIYITILTNDNKEIGFWGNSDNLFKCCDEVDNGKIQDVNFFSVETHNVFNNR